MFTTPSFNENFYFFIFLIHAVKNPILIIKNFDFLFYWIFLLDNKFFITAETLEILTSLHYTLDIAYYTGWTI